MSRIPGATLLALLLALLAAAAPAAASVTNSGDDLRTGWYPDQPSLTPQLVSGGTFGQLWDTDVVGQVYAQPLLHEGTVLVATEANRVYGLNPASGDIRWERNLGTPWNPGDIGCGDLTPQIGITSTPVIDEATDTAYLVKKSYVSGNSGDAVWRMHAVDVGTGEERPGFPVEIRGAAQNHPNQVFNPKAHLNRPGLLLMDGVVYVGFGSHCDWSTWQGWVFGITTAGETRARWVGVGAGAGAGIWQSGSGLMSDGSGRIIVGTGNPGAPPKPRAGTNPPANLGESIVRLEVQPDGSLKTSDFFAPFDAAELDSWDADFASGGPVALPDEHFGTPDFPHLAVAVGKQGYVYLLDRDNLGGIAMGPNGSDAVVQRIGPYGGVWSRAGVWPGDGGYVYIPTASGGNSAGGSTGFLRVYKYGKSGTGKPTLSLVGTSQDAFGFSSSAPVITSDGTTSGSALVWTIWTGGGSGANAQLRAYDPVPVGGRPVLRWSAPIGTSAKFAMPGVGAGRLYVGTRDGRVLGFGSPVTPPVTASQLSFGTTTIGDTATRTLTLTATDDVTISGIESSGGAYAVGTPSASLPIALTAGSTLSVPVSFAPTTTGLQGGTITVKTNRGDQAFGASGTGQSADAQLDVTPAAVSFGATDVGGHLADTVLIKNVGGAPLTIQEVDLPAAPYAVEGAPQAGDAIAPGEAVSVTVTFDPTEAGNYIDELRLVTNGGTKEIGLSAAAGDPGRLVVTQEENAFGDVPVGSTVSKLFTVTNEGATPVTITKSKPPVGGAFAATAALDEGTVLQPGETIVRGVSFAPTAAGHQEGVWQLNGNDATGLHEIRFTARGTVPAPDAGWRLNGNASLDAGRLVLTKTQQNRAGSAWWPHAVDSDGFSVTFEATQTGGTGGEGLTLTLADAAVTSPAALGQGGDELGFGGLTGTAVALDTAQSAGDPSANFAGITSGRSEETGALEWAATSTDVPDLRAASRTVRVESHDGVLTVWVEGELVLSEEVALAPKVLLGFTGATGTLTDRHEVSEVVVAGDPTPPAATLAVSHQQSGTAAYAPTFRGSCPSAFVAPDVAGGETVRPSLTNGAAGRTCALALTAPAGDGWSATVAVNGGPEQPLTAANGRYTIAPFALVAGENTVAVRTRHKTPGTIPDPASGGWQLNGAAALAGSELVLTPDAPEQAGSAFWPEPVDPRAMTVEFDAKIGPGTGADGMALVIADAAQSPPTAIGPQGGALGFSGIPGIAVALQTYKNDVNPSDNFVGITDGGTTRPDWLNWLATAQVPTALRDATHRVKVVAANGTLTVFVDGQQLLSQPVSLPETALIGFSAGTGGLTDRHAVANVAVTGATDPQAATLKVSAAVQAPAGSPQAGLEVIADGTCPSSFTTGALANGESATPALTGATTGTMCAVRQSIPAGEGWSTTASVNGGAPQTLSVVGGRLVVPPFALRGGENTVVLRNTWVEPTSVPDPSAGGWQLNGTAQLAGGGLQLTAAAEYQGGSAYWPVKLDPRGMTVEFDATIADGSGADGMALLIGDATRGALPTSLGDDGGGLGWGGVPGFAVALGTYQNAANPSNNFVGISDGPLPGSTDLLRWLGTAQVPTPLQNATHRVKVVAADGMLTVFVDGEQLLSRAVTLPGAAYLGFGAGTGGLTNRHAVSNLQVSGMALPAPASLSLRAEVEAPAGSPQAAATVSFAGSCPSDFTTGQLGDGDTATPALTGALAGTTCSVAQTVPAGPGWTVSASVNGGAPVRLQPQNGKVYLPDFALRDGANEVVVTSAWTDPTRITDPAAGGWWLNGTAAVSGTDLVLTEATEDAAGSAFWPHEVDGRAFSAEFDAKIGGGTGADGMAFIVGDAARGATPSSLGPLGGALGFAGIPGHAVALVTYQGAHNPSGNFLGITDGPLAAPDQLNWLATHTAATPLRDVTRRVRVVGGNGRLRVWLDGAPVLDVAATLPERALLGFSGGSGKLTDRHAVANVVVELGEEQTPVLAAAPTSLAFTAQAGGAAPAAKSLAVTATGGPADVTVSDDAAWLTATPATAATPAELQVTANPSGLAPGDYTGTITVSAAGATPLAVPVTLTVTAPPAVLTVAPASLEFSAKQGGAAPAARTQTVGNAGGGTLAFEAAGTAPWVAVAPASGTAPSALTVTVSTAGLAAGTYSAAVRITAPGAQDAPREVPVSLTVSPPDPVPTGLVGAWGFEEGAGATAGDSAGAAGAGAISGATWAAGRHGRGLAFDGINDWVTVADNAALDLTSAMTLEAWVRPATRTGWRTVMLKETPGNLAYALYASADNGRPSAHLSTPGDQMIRGTAQLPLNAWTHLAMTWDGTTQRFYVNGTQVAARAAGGTNVTSTGPLRFGGNSVWSEWFQGGIDEVRLYSRAISAAEIQADMATPVAASAATLRGATAQSAKAKAKTKAKAKVKAKARKGKRAGRRPGAKQVSPKPQRRVHPVPRG